jgi:hypothetical protein
MHRTRQKRDHFKKWRPIAELGWTVVRVEPTEKVRLGWSVASILCVALRMFSNGVTESGEGSVRVQQYRVFILFSDRWVPVTVDNKAHGDCTPGDQGECR